MYLDGTWSKEKLDENRVKLDDHLKTIQDDLIERNHKYELIKNSQINYETVAEFLSIANRFEQLLEEEEQQNSISSLFPTATMHVENSLLILHALLPQKVKIDIKVAIETIEEVMERELLERSADRRKRAQPYLKNHQGDFARSTC